MPTPAIQTLINDAQQVLNLDSISAVRSVVAVSLANANTGTPLNPNLTTQQLWNEFYQVVPRSKSDIESIIANQLMKFLFAPPAPGGVGANKQVIFNDGGVLAGDAGLTYDKATDALTVGNSIGIREAAINGIALLSAVTTAAMPATSGTTQSAGSLRLTATNTTGCLDMGTAGAVSWLQACRRTNLADNFALVLNPNGGNVGINTSAPESNLDVRGLIAVRGTPTFPSTGVGIESYYSAANTSSFIQSYDRGGGAFANLSYSALAHIWQINGGESMRLNSTGLGVGTTDTTNGRLNVRAGTAATGNSAFFNNSDGTYNPYLQIQHSSAGIKLFVSSAFGTPANNLIFGNGGVSETMRIDGSGQVGIGVTPSAWSSGLRAINFSTNGVLYANGGNSAFFGNNYYNDSGGTNRYLTNNVATAYGQVSGAHQWFTAPSGTAGTAITGANAFVQAMTLDASGNLLVGKTAIGTTVGVEVRPDGYIIATRSASTDAAAFTNAVYSTGASAYRFYVGLGGTVYATNTTISAISDARLKENVQDIDVGLGAILALKPRKFDWKSGKGKDIKGDRGFIAQEFEQVFPQLVDEWADPAPEGETPYKSVRQDLIPVLVKAIQELAAEVNALKNA